MTVSTPWRSLKLGQEGFEWGANGVSTPSIGDGACRLRYRRTNDFVALRLVLIGGSSTQWGASGETWYFTMPQIFANFEQSFFQLTQSWLAPALAIGGAAAFPYYGGLALVSSNDDGDHATSARLNPFFYLADGTGRMKGVASDFPFAWSTGTTVLPGQLIAGSDIEAFPN